MFKKVGSSLGIFVILAMFNVAHATNFGNCNGNGSCSSDTITTNQGGSGGIGIGGTGGTGVGTGIGTGGSADADANSSSKSNANSGAAAGSNSGGNSISIGGDDYDAPNIPVGSSIAAGANATAGCMKHNSISGNLFFVSLAKSGHERDYICTAVALGMPEVAVQMTCNADPAFKKAFNQRAQVTGTEYCID